MPIRQDSIFTAYTFTEEEYPLAVALTDLQEARLQDLMSLTAMQKMNLTPTPDNPVIFQLQHEYFRGMLDILKRIYDDSKETKEDLRQNAFEFNRNMKG